MTSLTIIGRRWFQRRNGNTYHTAEIIIGGEVVHKTPEAYGYGSQYEQSAQEWLEANGYLPTLRHYPNGSSEPLWNYCRDREIPYTSTVVDVSREKDL